MVKLSLYYREWLEREGDLEHHLDNSNLFGRKTSYKVRYLSPNIDEEQTAFAVIGKSSLLKIY